MYIYIYTYTYESLVHLGMMNLDEPQYSRDWGVALCQHGHGISGQTVSSEISERSQVVWESSPGAEIYPSRSLCRHFYMALGAKSIYPHFQTSQPPPIFLGIIPVMSQVTEIHPEIHFLAKEHTYKNQPLKEHHPRNSYIHITVEYYNS